jgi:serine protease SohB
MLCKTKQPFFFRIFSGMRKEPAETKKTCNKKRKGKLCHFIQDSFQSPATQLSPRPLMGRPVDSGPTMMEVLIFALKALIIVLSLGGLIILVAVLAARATQKSELEVEPLHKKYKDLAHFLKSFVANKEELKEEKKKRKAEKKAEKNEEPPSKKVFVLNFDGDINASQTDNLREEITALLQIATPQDEVVALVESPGGVVHGYGLAASQLLRIRERGIPLTVCVDKVAASGGYLMACVANRILAAPFAILGSIGVVAQVPNVHRLLKKHDVDYKEYTAGEYKRTVGMLGEITPAGEAHFQERLHDTHKLFKSFVHQFRPQVDLNRVANGDYWFGEEAKLLGLVDELKTSDDYLLSFPKDTPIFELSYEIKTSLQDKLSGFLGQAMSRAFDRVLGRLERSRLL